MSGFDRLGSDFAAHTAHGPSAEGPDEAAFAPSAEGHGRGFDLAAQAGSFRRELRRAARRESKGEGTADHGPLRSAREPSKSSFGSVSSAEHDGDANRTPAIADRVRQCVEARVAGPDALLGDALARDGVALRAIDGATGRVAEIVVRVARDVIEVTILPRADQGDPLLAEAIATLRIDLRRSFARRAIDVRQGRAASGRSDDEDEDAPRW